MKFINDYDKIIHFSKLINIRLLLSLLFTCNYALDVQIDAWLPGLTYITLINFPY